LEKKVVQNRWVPSRFILVTSQHVHPFYLERHDPTYIEVVVVDKDRIGVWLCGRKENTKKKHKNEREKKQRRRQASTPLPPLHPLSLLYINPPPPPSDTNTASPLLSSHLFSLTPLQPSEHPRNQSSPQSLPSALHIPQQSELNNSVTRSKQWPCTTE
jgi:hypothetical protein